MDGENNTNDHNGNSHNDKFSRDKKSVIKRIIVLGSVLVVILVISTYFLGTLVPNEYIIFFQIAEVSIIGYFVIEIVSNAVYKTTVNFFRNSAEAIRILIRIIGALIVVAFIVSFLSQNPIVATSIGTIAAIVVGFASQNIIGNIIAGLYLAVSRPFKIGDKITVFGYTGIIYDIDLLNSKLIDNSYNIILIPNLSMVTATIILQK